MLWKKTNHNVAHKNKICFQNVTTFTDHSLSTIASRRTNKLIKPDLTDNSKDQTFSSCLFFEEVARNSGN